MGVERARQPAVVSAPSVELLLARVRAFLSRLGPDLVIQALDLAAQDPGHGTRLTADAAGHG